MQQSQEYALIYELDHQCAECNWKNLVMKQIV